MTGLNKILLIVCLLLASFANAQTPPVKPVKIAVFAPVYLDSAFQDNIYQLGKNPIPRYMLPGIEFYNGIMLAVDSLNKEKAAVEVLFYDSKSADTTLEQRISDTAMQDVSLIISFFNTREEIKPLADFALEKKILLLSATYPNDGGITDNPFFALLNPTLNAHIEGIYKYMRRYYPLENITLFRKKGNVEDMIGFTLDNLNKKSAGTKLKLKTVELPDTFTAADVLGYLDSNRQNIFICGTLNETFGSNLSKAVSSNKNYRSLAIGMPTWDGIRDISKDLEIVYSTPYNFDRNTKTAIQLSNKYRDKYAGRASDMVFKGFESMYHFTKLLLKYGSGFVSHLSDKEFKLFNEYDIQPVKSEKDSTHTDYLENKKLYFIRKKDGMVRTVN